MSLNNQQSTTGNAAALREATQKARHVIHCAIVAGILRGDDAYNALDLCNAALSAPPRNCDVGTADEIESALCDYKLSRPSPPNGWRDGDIIDWLLSPAEEEGAK